MQSMHSQHLGCICTVLRAHLSVILHRRLMFCIPFNIVVRCICSNRVPAHPPAPQLAQPRPCRPSLPSAVSPQPVRLPPHHHRLAAGAAKPSARPERNQRQWLQCAAPDRPHRCAHAHQDRPYPCAPPSCSRSQEFAHRTNHPATRAQRFGERSADSWGRAVLRALAPNALT